MIPFVYSPDLCLHSTLQCGSCLAGLKSRSHTGPVMTAGHGRMGNQTSDLLMRGQNLISFLSGALVTESDVALG